MSMNIAIFATKKNKPTRMFPVWQTPTDTSYDILYSGAPLDAYRKWAKQNDADNSDWHLQKLDDWLGECATDGFRVDVKVL